MERLAPEPSWLGPRVFFDVAVAGRSIGRIVIELYAEKCPKACENFRQLCTGEFRPRGVPVGYRDCTFHRIVPGRIVQGGDCDQRDGTGCVSIYGHTFEDEPSALAFDEIGVVAMANSGKDTNGCQFFITLGPLPALNGTFVAIGKVIDGLFTLRQIGSVPVRPGTDTPELEVTIVLCGEL